MNLISTQHAVLVLAFMILASPATAAARSGRLQSGGVGMLATKKRVEKGVSPLKVDEAEARRPFIYYLPKPDSRFETKVLIGGGAAALHGGLRNDQTRTALCPKI
jgi:hypothetical protein